MEYVTRATGVKSETVITKQTLAYADYIAVIGRNRKELKEVFNKIERYQFEVVNIFKYLGVFVNGTNE